MNTGKILMAIGATIGLLSSTAAMAAQGRSSSTSGAQSLAVAPVHGVRGAELAGDDALAGEWSVLVLGPHFAGALVARDLGDDDVPDRDRRFSFATVYDRALVIAAARTLIARIAPEEISVRRGAA